MQNPLLLKKYSGWRVALYAPFQGSNGSGTFHDRSGLDRGGTSENAQFRAVAVAWACQS